MYESKADIKSKLIYLNYCLPKVKNQPINNKTSSQKPHNIPFFVRDKELWTAVKREVGIYRTINTTTGSCFTSFLACSRKKLPALKRSITCSSGCSHSSANNSQLYWNTHAFKETFSYLFSIRRCKKVITYGGYKKNYLWHIYICHSKLSDYSYLANSI